MNRPILTLKSEYTPNKAVPTKLDANEIIKILVDKFPLAFSLKTDQKKPLTIGIHQQLFAADTGLGRKVIRIGLAAYVRRASYLKAIVAGVSRVNLDGSNTGMVTESEAMYSVELLSKRIDIQDLKIVDVFPGTNRTATIDEVVGEIEKTLSKIGAGDYDIIELSEDD